MRVVMPSVNYADMVAVTLPAWRRLLPDADLRVVTSPEDTETQQVAREAGTSVMVTDAWSRDGAYFNKAAAMDVAFGFSEGAPPAEGEWCLSLDADAYPSGHLPASIEPDVIYGCDRRLCLTPQMLHEFQCGRVHPWHMKLRNVGLRCSGYFQLFAYRPGLRYGSYPHAGDYDIEFQRQFSRVEPLSCMTVLHLGPTDGKHNWHGKRSIPRWGTAA